MPYTLWLSLIFSGWACHNKSHQERNSFGTSGFYQLDLLFSVSIRCPWLHTLQQVKLCCISYSVYPVSSFSCISPSSSLSHTFSNKSRENWLWKIFTHLGNLITCFLNILVRLLFWDLPLFKENINNKLLTQMLKSMSKVNKVRKRSSLPNIVSVS